MSPRLVAYVSEAKWCTTGLLLLAGAGFLLGCAWGAVTFPKETP